MEEIKEEITEEITTKEELPSKEVVEKKDGSFQSEYSKTQRVLAIIAICFLVSFTIADIVLALVGVPSNYVMLSIALTIFVPIVVYFFTLMLKNKKK